jgi:dTDP-4-dehydrorhamnose reductase
VSQTETGVDHATPQPTDQDGVRGLRAPILLIGFDGMLGTAFRRLFTGAGVAFEAPTIDQLDITDVASVDDGVASRFRTVINCAAWTDVDGAEANRNGAHRLNAEAPGHLAQACARTGATLVHFSTDYVFDGQADTPYRIDHPIAPRSVYGSTKARGEQAIQAARCDHLIIRTSWLYAPWGRNFVLTMLRLLAERPELKVVNDQRGRPTSAEHLAHSTARLLSAGARSTFHVCDAGECTWFEFAAEIGRLANLPAGVSPCTTAEYPRPAPRPAYSVLDISRTEELIGPAGHWRDNLARVIQQTAPAANTAV